MRYKKQVSDTKQDVLDLLRELRELTLLDEGDPQSFRVRAYENAAASIAAQASDLGRLSIKELQKIKGVGKSTAEKIVEFINTGRVQRLEALREKYPRSLVRLLRVPGLGPKAVVRLYQELGVNSLEDFKRAVAERRVQKLRGVGPKSEEKLALALARLEEQGSLERTPISVALPHAERLVAELLGVPSVKHAAYCGSLRRFAETIGDIDIVVVSEEPAQVMQAVVELPQVERVIARGDAKTSVVTQRGMQVDVRVVLPHRLGAALIHLTGSKAHTDKLRTLALARGLTLNEHGLAELESGKVVASETEEEIYRALGLSFIPPLLREDTGEIEAAERGSLPRPIGALFGDFHLHTTLSGDGRSTLEEMVVEAKARGYLVLAITDHAEGTLPGVGREALLAQRARVRALQASLGDELRLLHGVELNVGPDGELDFDAEFRQGFDFCLASVHSHFELDRARQTRRVVRAMQDPSVKMIGHLTARLIGARPPIELELDAVLDAAEATGTALEVNGALPRLDVSVDILRRAAGRDIPIVLTSDAHHTRELRLIEYAAKNAERAWLGPDQVANTWQGARLHEWLG